MLQRKSVLAMFFFPPAMYKPIYLFSKLCNPDVFDFASQPFTIIVDPVLPVDIIIVVDMVVAIAFT
jgi:hypothetical protein